jgi:hypothetical protein
MSINTPKRFAFSLQEAVDGAPTLARLNQIAAASSACLATISPLLPPDLRQLVRPAGLADSVWCILAPHNAAAAKLRQLTPALLAHLQTAGHQVSAIRIKVERGR